MKSHLEIIPTTDMSREDWLRYRLSGVGASEVGTLMGLNPYKSSIQLFYEKVGQELQTLETLSMFMGKESEDFIANLWQYWPKEKGDSNLMMANYRAGKIIRRSQRVNAYVRNPKYPWLFVSLDRKINKYDNRGEGALELKRLGGREAEKWVGGIVPSHVVQVQTQLLVPEFDYGELAVLQDGPEFYVFPFEESEPIKKSILQVTKDFWDRVCQARMVLTQQFDAQRNFNLQRVQECHAEMQRLEPEPDGTQAYADFLKKKYSIDTPGEKKGTDKQLEAAKKHKLVTEQIRELETVQLKYENQLKRDMGDKWTVLNFGDNGLVSWRANVNKVRVFLNKVHPA